MAQRANLPANDNFGYIGKLVDLVEYQAVSITTKTLADKKVGKVDLFAFTEGQSLGEHLSRFDDLAYILDGEAEITIAGTIFHVKAGEMILWGLVESKKPPTFSARVEAGHRAITVPVDEINSISGMLEPGDLIDLMVTLEKNGKKRTIPLLQSVQIMATGQRSVDDPKSGERRLYSTVTLDTDLVQAQNLIMAREVGHLTALLRNPQDKALTARSQSEISTLLGLTSAGKDSASGAVDVPVLYGGGAAKLPPEGLHMGSPLSVVNTGEISAPKPNTPIQVQVVPTPGQGIPGSVAGAAR